MTDDEVGALTSGADVAAVRGYRAAVRCRIQYVGRLLRPDAWEEVVGLADTSRSNLGYDSGLTPDHGTGWRMPHEDGMERIALRTRDVVARAGVHRETLRYYERRGLIPVPPRRSSGYRMYPADTVERVRLVKWAQDLGFKLREIAELSRIPRDHVGGRAARVRAAAAVKIREIDDRIHRLQAMKRRLRAITLCRCSGDCPIVARAASNEERRRHNG